MNIIYFSTYLTVIQIVKSLLRSDYLGLDKLKFDKFSALKMLAIAINFFLVTIAWVFFRANNVSDAFLILGKIFTQYGIPFMENGAAYFYSLIGLSILLIKEISDEFLPEKFSFLESKNPILSALASATLIVIILSIGVFDGGQFIYFQF